MYVIHFNLLSLIYWNLTHRHTVKRADGTGWDSTRGDE